MTHDQKTRLARIKERKRAVLEARARARQVVVAPTQRHGGVRNDLQVIDAVRAGDHPHHQRGDLQPRVGALVGRDTEMGLREPVQPRGAGQREHRDQPGRRHQVRIVEPRRGGPGSVAELDRRDALPVVNTLPIPP